MGGLIVLAGLLDEASTNEGPAMLSILVIIPCESTSGRVFILDVVTSMSGNVVAIELSSSTGDIVSDTTS